MMGKTIYSKCQEMISKFKKGEEIGANDLTTLIIINIGGQKRTIQNAITVMLATKLIKDIGTAHFKIL